MNSRSQEYQEHPIFDELNVYFEFYKDLSFIIMGIEGG